MTTETLPDYSEKFHEPEVYAYDVPEHVFEDLDLPDLPAGYGYVGGAARAVAQHILFGRSATIRDLDIVAFSERNPDMSHADALSRQYMPDDHRFGYGVHQEYLKHYFTSRDFTCNEVTVLDGTLLLTSDAYEDMRDAVVAPSRHLYSMSDITYAKSHLLLSVFERDFGEASSRDIPEWNIDGFAVALGLNKALQCGQEVAERYVELVGFLPESDPLELASGYAEDLNFEFRGFAAAEAVNDDTIPEYRACENTPGLAVALGAHAACAAMQADGWA